MAEIIQSIIYDIPGLLRSTAPTAFIVAIISLGVFITFRILDFPDLTVDGSFPLGMAIMTIAILNGYNPFIALIISFFGGVNAGIVTALIHNYLKVPGLLAGILTMIMLYSINIRILGGSNISIMNDNSMLSGITNLFNFMNPDITAAIFFGILVFIIKFMLDIFFHTDLGLLLRAIGNNQQLILNQGVNPNIIKILGVGLSNGIVAFAGCFNAQYNKFADLNLGQGIIITGLASVMIGEVLLPSKNIFFLTLRVIIGAFVYQLLMNIARYYINFKPTDLKLITGILIVIILIASNIIKYRKKYLNKIVQK